MKKLIFVMAVVFFSMGAQAQKYFTILGKIEGKADGMKVFLKKDNWPDYTTVDSTVIKKGQFKFKGSVPEPAMYQVMIDPALKGQKSEEGNLLVSRFYLENSAIEYMGDIKTLPTAWYKPKRLSVPPVIKGSATEDEYNKYLSSRKELSAQLKTADDAYLKEYHIPSMEGVFNTEKGIALAKEYNDLSEKLDALKWNYIKTHASSPIAYDLAMQYFTGMYVNLTVPQIDELVSFIKAGRDGKEKMKEFEKTADKAKITAIGTKYQDFQFLTPDGKKVMLSQYVPEGKYVMLEFWASWCGPCRGEIPHLREINKTKKDNFEIVSISLDERDADWKKAMKEENMVWTQLSDPQGFEGEIAKAYGILGIPFSLLLDKEGKIIKVEVRGAQLDLALQGL